MLPPLASSWVLCACSLPVHALGGVCTCCSAVRFCPYPRLSPFLEIRPRCLSQISPRGPGVWGLCDCGAHLCACRLLCGWLPEHRGARTPGLRCRSPAAILDTFVVAPSGLFPSVSHHCPHAPCLARFSALSALTISAHPPPSPVLTSPPPSITHPPFNPLPQPLWKGWWWSVGRVIRPG